MNENSYLKPSNYKEYKEWLDKTNSTGAQPKFDAASDLRIKKFLNDSISDDILRKQIMLGLASDGIIDSNIANLFIIKRLRDLY